MEGKGTLRVEVYCEYLEDLSSVTVWSAIC